MIYIDYDGTLKEWDKNVSLEKVGEASYPLFQSWLPAVRYAVKKLCKDYPGQVTVYTAVLNTGVERTKRLVIENTFGKDVSDKMVVTTYNGNKRLGVGDNPKFGIKCYNGINGTKGTWDGLAFRGDADPDETYAQLKAAIDSILSVNPDADILVDDFTENLYAWEGREREFFKEKEVIV